MKKLIEGLHHFEDHVLWQWKELFERSMQGQKPQALLTTCAESRVLPETLIQADPSDLFVSRNAGNFVLLPKTPGGEAATVEYAVATLGVTDLVGDAPGPLRFQLTLEHRQRSKLRGRRAAGQTLRIVSPRPCHHRALPLTSAQVRAGAA